MNSFLRYTIALLVTYLLAWTASYVFIFLTRGDGMDFSHYLKYFVLAWTFNGFELPTFILILSIVVFVPLAVLVVIQMRRREKQGGNVA